MVRLKATVAANLETFPNAFQFQYGSIKRLTSRLLLFSLVSCFNSNMVRLKDNDFEMSLLLDEMFQFQYGSIKRLYFSIGAVSTTLFQFQYGSIKS